MIKRRWVHFVLLLALLLSSHPLQGAVVEKVNLNTATLDQLDRLPGIGPVTARRIIEFRENNGPFERIEELMHVRGIGEKTFLKLRPYLTVEEPDSEGQAEQRPQP